MPCRPGAGSPPLRAAAARGSCWPSASATVVGSSHCAAGQELRALEPLVADVGVLQRAVDQRQHARLVDDVGGEEHLTSRRRSRSIAWSAASASLESAVRTRSAIDCRPSRRISIVIRNERCARGHLAGRGDRLRLLVLLVGLAAEAVDLRGEVVALRRVAQQVEERLGDLLVGGAGERADVRVVVAQRVLLRRVLAAADDEDEQDEDEQDAAAEHGAADQQRLVIRRTAVGDRRRREAAPRAGPVCVARRPRRRRTRSVSPGWPRARRAAE